MGKIIIVLIAVVASLMLADSLTCNQCTYGLLGYCLSSNEETCTNSNYTCFTAKISFDQVPSVGINSQGCRMTTGCNTTINGTLAGVSYSTKIECCNTDKCNPVQLSAAPSTKMTLSAAIGVAVLASMLGSIQ